MTEAEWLACTDPQSMLEYLRGNVSARQLQLFACACARRVPHLMTTAELNQVVEVAERSADAASSKGELLTVIEAALQLPYVVRHRYTAVQGGYVHFDIEDDGRMQIFHTSDYHRHSQNRYAAEGALWATFAVWKEAWRLTERLSEQTQLAVRCLALSLYRGDDLSRSVLDFWMQESVEQAQLLRHVTGNVFRPVIVDIRWLTPTVVSLAQAIYGERAFDRLPILADALADAGCTDAQILAHCRGLGRHVRGCWVVELSGELAGGPARLRAEAKLGKRKLRLFACACCRRIWHLMPDDYSRRVVEVGERYADGLATEGELVIASDAVEARITELQVSSAYFAKQAAAWVGKPGGQEFREEDVCGMAVRAASFDNHASTIEATECDVHCRNLRDIFGNPFCLANLERSWLTSTVIQLAQSIYEERSFDRMPILADALEDVGCDDQHVLHHCRVPTIHVRGCWVIDKLLGKE